MEKWMINTKSAIKISLKSRKNKWPQHQSDCPKNLNTLIKRYLFSNKIACMDGFCNRR